MFIIFYTYGISTFNTPCVTFDDFLQLLTDYKSKHDVVFCFVIALLLFFVFIYFIFSSKVITLNLNSFVIII